MKIYIITLLSLFLLKVYGENVAVDIYVIEEPKKHEGSISKLEHIEELKKILLSKDSKVLNYMRAILDNNGNYKYDGTRKLEFYNPNSIGDILVGNYLSVSSVKEKDLISIDLNLSIRNLDEWFVVDANKNLLRPIIKTRAIETNLKIPINHFSLIGGFESEGKQVYTYVCIRNP